MWKNSIRNKLMVFLLAATVIPIATSVVFSYVYTKNAMEDKSIRENARLMFQGKTNLIHYFNILNQTSMTAYTGSNMNNTLFHILQGGDSDYLSRNEIYRSLQYMANSIEDIHQIYLYMEKSHRSYLLVQNRLYPRVSADIHEYFSEREMSRVQVLPTRWSRLYGTNPYPTVPNKE